MQNTPTEETRSITLTQEEFDMLVDIKDLACAWVTHVETGRSWHNLFKKIKDQWGT